MRDAIATSLHPHIRDLVDDVRRASADISSASNAMRAGGGGGGGGGYAHSPMPTAMEARMLLPALVPEIEAIVSRALEGKRLVADANAVAVGSGPGMQSAGTPAFATPAPPPHQMPQQQTSQQQQQVSRQHVQERQQEKERQADEAARKAEEAARANAAAAAAEAAKPKPKPKPEPKPKPNSAASSVNVNPRALTEAETRAIHSAIRWNKPLGELAALITSADQANCEDAKNGNRPLHIAAQNGFTHVCKLLIAKHAEINAVNVKNNTALHMALGYDYDECAEFLVDAGADPTIVNEEGHAAKNGLEGDKGPDGFVTPLNELREARSVEQSLSALNRIER
jgi:chemotaxis protein histidine kinase CheA